jgi:hypothetical protein
VVVGTMGRPTRTLAGPLPAFSTECRLPPKRRHRCTPLAAVAHIVSGRAPSDHRNAHAASALDQSIDDEPVQAETQRSRGDPSSASTTTDTEASWKMPRRSTVNLTEFSSRITLAARAIWPR